MSPNSRRGDIDDTGEWESHRVAVFMALEDLKTNHTKLEDEIDGTREALHKRISRHAEQHAAKYAGAIRGLQARLRSLELDLVKLQTKAMIWGAVAGFLITTVTAAVGTLISVWRK